MKQRNTFTRYWQFMIVAVFAAVAFLFWMVVCPSLLSDREQTMLFLLTADYFHQRIIVPGGLARYLGEFVTQFFCVKSAGAAVFTILLLLAQWLSLTILHRQGFRDTIKVFLLSFVPSVILWFLATLPSVSMTLIAAVVIVLAAMALMPLKKVPSVVYIAVMVPVCYWLAGPMTWLLVIYALFSWFRTFKSLPWALYLSACAALLLFFSIMYSSFHVSYPMSQLMSGIDYYWSEPYTPKFKQTMEVSDQMLLRGYVNSSQRNAFEAMELTPNYNKSARVLLRLTDTSIATGQYELALKYISLLEETLFYKERARKLRNLVEKPELLKGTSYDNLKKIYQTTADEFFL